MPMFMFSFLSFFLFATMHQPKIQSFSNNDIFHKEMVLIKGGTFIMGTPTDYDKEKQYPNSPEIRHKVKLDDYYISKYEVTHLQWRTIMGSTPDHLGFRDCGKCPVERVSWDEVQVFIQKLNEITGAKYRLPTEAEWEYAARGGQKSKGFWYSGSKQFDEVAWCYENSEKKTHSVGSKKPNELGLFDMSGNVMEWCSDWHEEYSNADQYNPVGPKEGTGRNLRGGAWELAESHCRVFLRKSSMPSIKHSSIGFRLAK